MLLKPVIAIIPRIERIQRIKIMDAIIWNGCGSILISQRTSPNVRRLKSVIGWPKNVKRVMSLIEKFGMLIYPSNQRIRMRAKTKANIIKIENYNGN